MDLRDDIIRTCDGIVCISRVEEALLRIQGVEAAHALTEINDEGLLVIGLLTISDSSDLTPAAVLNFVRENEPPDCWPNRVLFAYEGPRIAAQAA